MRELSSFFSNPFSGLRIGLDRKKAFGDDTIERITVQNTNGQLDELLASTKAVQLKLVEGTTGLLTTRAERKSRTQTTDSFIEEFKARNSKLNAYFIANEIAKQSVYTEFFPQGMQPFTEKVTKENVEQRMTTMVNAITNNTTVAGGDAVLQQYTDLLTNYKAARSEQLNKTGQVSTGEDVLDEIEAAWDDQMFSNLLTFARLNRNQPENISLYMNSSLLEADARPGTTLTGKLRGMVTDNAGHPVKNVVVHILDGKMDNAHSNEDGIYFTHALPIGTWQVEYSKGDRKVMKEIAIKQGEELTVDVVL